MSAAMSKQRLLLAGAVLSYLTIFVAVVLFETPGLGIGRFFNVSVVLLALATGLRGGVAGGMLATALYAVGVLLSPKLPTSEIATLGTAFRLASFVAVGALIGWFASTNRSLMAELRLLADRDSLTGLPNTRAFERAIMRRLEGERPFTLLVGDMASLERIDVGRAGADGNESLRRLADLLARSLAPDDELARVG